ncbi:hypothetical protein B0H17DRAFT_1195411 [Mycena rosella]|uniref:Uncharacterized protein n=1 Tax=Mycena rosella TaxID=1033263 RepID=A0AAD7DWW8_MYCRO|nr:hypothetical protein B0H17DRAFT_1195411 [Mycena rosella]
MSSDVLLEEFEVRLLPGHRSPVFSIANKSSNRFTTNQNQQHAIWAPLKRRPTVPTIPKEQTEGWERTREILPPALFITHDLLEVGAEVLKFAPIPDVSASLLLSIWDSVQGVDMQCCTNLLLSVQLELHKPGNKVEKEMAKPMEKLVETFTQVRDFLLKQAHRPFLKRYLKHEEILRDISGCETLLSGALSMFSLQVQMRILKQVKETEDGREAENRTILDALLWAQQQRLPGLPDEHDDILPALQSLHSTQNTLDFAHDTADLRGLMCEALAQNSDVEMLRVLQMF